MKSGIQWRELEPPQDAMNRPNDPPINHTDFQLAFPRAIEAKILPFARPAIQRILRWQELNDLHARVAWRADDGSVWGRILRSLNVRYEVSTDDLAGIPAKGPLVVVANHPYGGIEGIILAVLLQSVRSDVKVMANSILHSIPCLQGSLIPVDPFGSRTSTIYNTHGLKTAIQWLRRGGVLAIFPAGEVAHVDVHKRAVTDSLWHPAAAALARRTSAAVLPVFFAGCNGPAFQILSMVHPIVRTMLLPTELLNKRNQTFQVHVGHPITFRRLNAFTDDVQMTDYLRERTYLLANRRTLTPVLRPLFPWRRAFPRTIEAVCGQPEGEQLAEEIRGLPSDQTLLESGNDLVLLAEAGQIPNVLKEIGRLREITFRSVGEGTGRELDLDEFDSYYRHLFVWRKSSRQILGAYRFGQTDVILESRGKVGLYTSTLFEFQEAFFKNVGPALELGRSFVRMEFQGAMGALPLLWKGIGRFVVRNPRYKILFGPVSISSSYNPVSRQMMVSYLWRNHLGSEISPMIKPRAPVKLPGPKRWQPEAAPLSINDAEELGELISDIETDRKRIPVLLKHYLKLRGKVAGFNRDASFCDVIDSLIVVDLTKTDQHLLERFMAPEGARQFTEYHKTNRQG